MVSANAVQNGPGLVPVVVRGNPREVDTRRGRRAVVDVEMPGGDKKAVWRGPGDPEVMLCRDGMRVMAGFDEQGNIWLATPGADLAPVPPQPEAPADGQETFTFHDVAFYAKREAAILNLCLIAVRQQVGDTVKLTPTLEAQYAERIYTSLRFETKDKVLVA